MCLNWGNRTAFCDHMENFRLHQMDEVAAAVRRGLQTQLPPIMLKLIRWDDLEKRVCGNPDVDVKLLASVTEYGSGYSDSNDLIKWFWQVLDEFSLEERKAFLRFAWGRARLPLTRALFSQRMKLTELRK